MGADLNQKNSLFIFPLPFEIKKFIDYFSFDEFLKTEIRMIYSKIVNF